jgi:transcriptional regulator with XRE-family HTH domain
MIALTTDPRGTVEPPVQAAPGDRRREAGMLLVRRLLGDVLRATRLRQGRTLREVSASARVSLGYLSEVERGQKEASSELLSSICSALDVPLSEVLHEVADQLQVEETLAAIELTGPAEPAHGPLHVTNVAA